MQVSIVWMPSSAFCIYIYECLNALSSVYRVLNRVIHNWQCHSCECFCYSTDAETVTVNSHHLNAQYYDDRHVKCSCWSLYTFIHSFVRQRGFRQPPSLCRCRCRIEAICIYAVRTYITYYVIIKTFSIPTRCDVIQFHRAYRFTTPTLNEPFTLQNARKIRCTHVSRSSLVTRCSSTQHPLQHIYKYKRIRSLHLCVSQKHTISIKLQFKCRFSLSGKTNAVSIIIHVKWNLNVYGARQLKWWQKYSVHTTTSYATTTGSYR